MKNYLIVVMDVGDPAYSDSYNEDAESNDKFILYLNENVGVLTCSLENIPQEISEFKFIISFTGLFLKSIIVFEQLLQ